LFSTFVLYEFIIPTASDLPEKLCFLIEETNPKEAFVTTNFDLEYVPKKFALKKVLVLGEIARGVKNV